MTARASRTVDAPKADITWTWTGLLDQGTAYVALDDVVAVLQEHALACADLDAQFAADAFQELADRLLYLKGRLHGAAAVSQEETP